MKNIIRFLISIFLLTYIPYLVAIFGLSEIERKIKNITRDIKQEQKKVIAQAYYDLNNHKDHRYTIIEQAQRTLNETGWMLAMGIVALGAASNEEEIDSTIVYDIKRDVANFSQKCAEDLIKQPNISRQDAHNVLDFHDALCTGGIRKNDTDCDRIKARLEKLRKAKS